MLVSIERSRNADVEIRNQRPADTKIGGYQSAVKAGSQKQR